MLLQSSRIRRFAAMRKLVLSRNQNWRNYIRAEILMALRRIAHSSSRH
jgi:hypothetical protein